MTDRRSERRREVGRILLASSREWLASALRAVLEPAGFAFEHTSTGAASLERAIAAPPDVVIVDEGLPDRSVPELCTDLAGLSLARSLPILVYSPAFWHESEQAAAMRAGAWDVVREPIRSRLLVAKLERLIQIKRLIEASGAETPEEGEGPLTLPGLFRFLPVLAALAGREGRPLGCAVLGPTRPDRLAADAEGASRDMAAFVARNTRRSDVLAWLGERDLALIAFGADLSGLGTMMERLTSRAETEGTWGERLSAGLVELDVAALAGRSGDGAAGSGVPDRVAPLARIAAAQAALRRARDAGGGVRVADAP